MIALLQGAQTAAEGADAADQGGAVISLVGADVGDGAPAG